MFNARRGPDHPPHDLAGCGCGGLLREGRPPAACNLRALYAKYRRDPAGRDRIVARFLRSLTADVPAHTWSEAHPTLRPVLKSAGYLEHAHTLLRRSSAGDVLPSAPFAGDLYGNRDARAARQSRLR